MDLIAEQTMGYNKDKIASLVFVFAFFFVYFAKDFRLLKPIILSMLVIAFFIDMTFTLNPKFHFVPMGNNLPTHVILAGFVAALGVLFLHRNIIRF